MNEMKLMLSIVERGQGKILTKLYGEHGVTMHFQSIGRGTASSELLEVLGFGGSERTVLLSFGAGGCIDGLMELLDQGTMETAETKGIVVSLPLTGMSRIMAVLAGQVMPGEQETGKMEKNGKNSLILIVANHGHTDEIMNTARAAGARGGTILRSRWAGPEDTEGFYGMKFQKEKEIVVILTSADKKAVIMETVNRKHGMKTEAGAMICSVGIDQTVRLG